MAYNPQPGYVQVQSDQPQVPYVQGQTGYPPQGQPGNPPQGQPGYPPQGQPGYPPQGQPGYPPPGQAVYPQAPYAQYPQGQPMPGAGQFQPQMQAAVVYNPNMAGAPGVQIQAAGGVIQQQPMAAGGRPPVQWMQISPDQMQALNGKSCPPGLEYLNYLDQVLVHQQVELLEVLTGWETANKYAVKNSLGQQCYFAVEDSNFCTRQCCGPSRPFTMKLLSNAGGEVMRIERPCRCQACCCFCCLQEMTMEAPPGQVIGSVKQDCSICAPCFTVYDATGNPTLKIEGPCCTCKCCADVVFEVKNMEGNPVGRITKQFSGMLKEYFTDADNFGVTFPHDMDVRLKCVLLGATFLIDFMFFEDNQQQNRNN